MKIRAITLTDVRQFSQTVRIAGFANGLNVLSAPNETGKSTLFDAIQAVFFIPHRSNAAAIKALRPDVGGNPAITLELELPSGIYRIEKIWGKGAKAEVWQDSRLIAKSDEAEAWVARLTTPAEDGGPAGLLWVRQGLVTLQDGSKKEQDAAETARRDLLSSVTGEVDSLTGGRRMDKALARARDDLEKLVTLRGAKTGGPLDLALKRREALETARQEQKAKAKALQDALVRRRSMLSDLTDLTDPAAVAQRQKRLNDATEAYQAGLRHAETLKQAELAAASAKLRHDQSVQRLNGFDTAQAALQRAELALPIAALAGETAIAAHLAAQTSMTAAQDALAAERAALAQAEAQWQAALQAEAAQATARRRAELALRITKAAEIETTLAPLRQAARQGLDRKALDQIEAAAQDLAVQERVALAGAAQFSITYSGDVRAQHNGMSVQGDVPMPILEQTTLDLPGFGQITLTPSANGNDLDALQNARNQLATLLKTAGFADLEAARAAFAARSLAEQNLRDRTADLRALAPDGVSALRDELAQLPEPAVQTDLPKPEVAAATVNNQRNAVQNAEANAEQARRHWQAARETEIRADLALAAARDTLAKAKSLLADLAATSRADLAGTAAAYAATLAEARASHAALLQAAPDLAALTAAQTRARSVHSSAEAEIAALREERTRLDTHIDIHAGNGVEEDLADTELQLADAAAQVAALEREVAVLRRLIAALDMAKATARDRYFDPVIAELRPMLRLLWPDADLKFDADSLLPTQLIRDGHPEDIGSLSGGTREQIALLVRLAFARLLAKSGRHAPVILDDALVYTDDDRIERMFDALHQQAADLQIIVLSCRSRVFRDLGGRKLGFEPVALALA